MLAVHNLVLGYGENTVVHDVSLKVEQGEVVTLIGANGAGKTTLLRCMVGYLRPRSGSVELEGTTVNGLSPSDMVTRGITMVPEGRRIFPTLTVEENIKVGAFSRRNPRRSAARMDEMYQTFPILRERKKQLGGSLSGGEQQMLALARALMSEPRILLLDEPSMGLAPLVVEQIFEQIRKLRETGTTILLVEQNATLALSTSDRAYILERGRIVLAGRSSELIDRPEVKEAYLGL